MPSASSKLEKQASSEACDPIRQGITLVEHKIRNLMKKKGRLDTYREIQKSGKELDSDQKQAILKYDEVCQNLAFTQELSKQLNQIALEWTKQQKKKEKKEAYERDQQEAAKVKEILIIQDVLASMGSDTVREDFLAGKNKAVQLTETELNYLDELFGEVSPKREHEEGQPPFLEQAQNAAKHLLNLVEGKDKEIVGTKYSTLKEIIDKINNCGYFNQSSEETAQEAPAEVVHEEMEIVQPAEPEHTEVEPEHIPATTFQQTAAPASIEPVAPVVETAGLYISQRPMADVLTNVMGAGPTTFNFIQESELEPDVVTVVPAPMPIPSQTFTNASFAPPPGAVFAPPQPEVMYSAPAPPTQYSPVPQPAVPTQQFEPSDTFQNTSQTGSGDWNEPAEPSSEWSTQVEQRGWNDGNAQPSDEWSDSNNDGFQTAGRGGGRGGRGRGGERGRGGRGGRGGGYQNGRGSSQNGRGGGGGGGYYNRNSEGGYHQNGYQPRGDGERSYRGDRDGERSYRGDRDGERSYRGDRDGERSYRGDRDGGPRRGGPRGGGQDRGGPRSDRGAPRGRGNNPRGGNRGGRQ